MVAGIRGAMVIAAGTIRYSFWKFLIADGLGAIVSGGLFIALGYWAGRQLGDLESLELKIQHYERYVIIGLAAVVVLIVLWVWLKKKLPRPIIEQAMQKAVETAEQVKPVTAVENQAV